MTKDMNEYLWVWVEKDRLLLSGYPHVDKSNPTCCGSLSCGKLYGAISFKFTFDF
ncbi:hypothetical protein JCM10914A_19590 [Paenibacillus sp. JCM 10914]